MSANSKSDKKSVAARPVAMAQERYLVGVSEDGEPFGADRARPHLAILLRAGKAGLRAELASRYFAETGTVAGGQALTPMPPWSLKVWPPTSHPRGCISASLSI